MPASTICCCCSLVTDLLLLGKVLGLGSLTPILSFGYSFGIVLGMFFLPLHWIGRTGYDGKGAGLGLHSAETHSAPVGLSCCPEVILLSDEVR